MVTHYHDQVKLRSDLLSFNSWGFSFNSGGSSRDQWEEASIRQTRVVESSVGEQGVVVEGRVSVGSLGQSIGQTMVVVGESTSIDQGFGHSRGDCSDLDLRDNRGWGLLGSKATSSSIIKGSLECGLGFSNLNHIIQVGCWNLLGLSCSKVGSFSSSYFLSLSKVSSGDLFT